MLLKRHIELETYFLCLYFALAPFEYMLNFGQGTLLRFIAACFVGLTLLHLIIARQQINILDPIILSPILIIVISQFSLLWSVDIGMTKAMNLTYLYLQVMFIFVYVKKYNVWEQDLIKKAILLGGLTVSVFTYFFSPEILSESKGGRMALNHADPNEFAALLILPLFVSFGEIIYHKSKINIFLFLGILYIIILTGSRGAFLAISITLLYHLIKKFSVKNITLLLLFGFFFFFLVIPQLPPQIFERLFSENPISNELNGGGRAGIWMVIFNEILPKMPIFGYGSGCSGIIIAPFWGTVVASHNTYLRLILEYGLLVLPIFIYFLYRIYKLIKWKKDFVRIYVFISILIVVLFLDAYFKKYLWNALMFCVISNDLYTDTIYFRLKNIDKNDR